MPSFQDTAVLVVLALLLFGPKKLPELARQLGKLMADFRRASNDFRSQMEEELRISEQAERQKQVAAIEAAAPASPAIDVPEHPHLLPPESDIPSSPETWNSTDAPSHDTVSHYMVDDALDPQADPQAPVASPQPAASEVAAESAAPAPPAPLPIATSGDLSIMPPATGLPIPISTTANGASHAHEADLETETLHG